MPTNSTVLAAADVSTMAEQKHPPMRKKCYLLDFKKLPNQDSIDILMQPLKALFVANSKLSRNAHVVRLCAEDGRGSYVLCFMITSEILEGVIIP